MQFHFLTKDFYEDYNIVGWMPPADMSFLNEWKKFNVQDYPELLILRTGANWIIYATSLPTGRKDYMQRDNQLHLIITGSVGEGGRICGFLKEVYPYLLNEYNNNESSKLLQITSNHIHEGEPVIWAKQTEEEKRIHAKALGDQLEGWGGCGDAQWSFDEDRWYGGDINAREDFQAACEFLLTREGQFNGAAVSLLGIGQDEIDSFIDPDKKWDYLAILVNAQTPRTALPEPDSGKNRRTDSDGKSGGTKSPIGETGDKTGEDSDNGQKAPAWRQAVSEWGAVIKKWVSNPKSIILIAVLLLGSGFGIFSYNNHCNNCAIAQIEQAIQDNQAVDQKVFDRVAKLAEKNDSAAEFALGCYYLVEDKQDLKKAEDFFNRVMKHGPEALQEKAKLKLSEIEKIRKTSRDKDIE